MDWRLGMVMGMALAAGACDDTSLPGGSDGRGSPDVTATTDGATGDDVGDVTADATAGEDTATAPSDTTSPDDVVTPTGCTVADQVFTPFCVECHDEGRVPDLRAGALGRLAGTAAYAYPGETLVVAGDPAASFLLTKMEEGHTRIGAVMPPDGALSDAQRAVVEAWIADGAAACAGVPDPGVLPPLSHEPGGPITFGALPSGFQATKPAWADEGTCTAQQWWKFQGDTESSSMHPGQECVSCHVEEHGPALSYGGTVYPSLYEADDCRGVEGVSVSILDADGNTLATTVTNKGGNFYWRRNALSFRAGYRARLSYQGRQREMELPQYTSGDCNACHGAQGTDGSPGRLVAP